LQELSKEQLVEAIKIPTSHDIRPKYLQGRRQPGEHYNFEFEFGLPERIVTDLQKTKTSGGVLPVLQISCERLYRTAKAREEKSLLTFRSKPLVVSSPDYEKLGPPDTQIRQYIDEAIQAGIAEQFPHMKEFDLEDERDRWKDVLHGMVYKQSDNTALTRICSEQELQITASKMECLADLAKMANFLSSGDRRILRNDPRGGKTTLKPLPFLSSDDRGILPSDPRTKKFSSDPSSAPVYASTQSQGDSSTTCEPTEPDTQYYSLGHDAIAVELDYWGSARNVIKTRQGFLRRVVEISYKAFAVYLIGIAMVVGFVSSDALDKSILGVLLILLLFGIGMWTLSHRVARRVSGRLIRSPLFRAFLTSRPAE
jgi:hypothetical protein